MIIHLICPARGTNAQRIFIRRGATIPEDQIRPAALPLFCLAPHGVFPASRIASPAVSSYLAFSPLPALFSKNRRCIFCDTLRHRNFSTATPACFTRHAAVWCSDFPPANPVSAGLTSDHLPSANNLARKKESGSQETMNQESRNVANFLRRGRVGARWLAHRFRSVRDTLRFPIQNGGRTLTTKMIIIASAIISLA